MVTYLSIIALTVIVFLYSKFKRESVGVESTRVGNFIIFLSLWLVSGLRINVGTDFPAYRSYFISIDNYSFESPFFERGYYLLNKVLSLFTDNPQYLFLLTSFIILFLVYNTLEKVSVSVPLSFFLFITMYFYFNSFNLVRQYIAISLVFYSVKYIISDDLFKFLIIIGISSAFHISTLIIIPFYWILKMNFNRAFYALLLFVSLGLSFYTPQLIQIMSLVIPSLSNYTYYTFEGASANTVVLFSLITFIISLIYKRRLLKLNKDSIVFINSVYFGLVFAILSKENIMFNRFAMYFYIFSIVLIPLYLKVLNKNLRVIAYMLVISGMTLYNLYLLSHNNADALPYIYNEELLYNFIAIAGLFGVIWLYFKAIKVMYMQSRGKRIQKNTSRYKKIQSNRIYES